MKMRIVRQGILGAVLNAVFMILIYQVSYNLPLPILIWSLYLIPTAINILVFWHAVGKLSIRKQLGLFGVMAGISLICYGVFAYFFEMGTQYADFIEKNLILYKIPKESYGSAKGRFFAVVPFLYTTILNFAVQYAVNGTKRNLTREDIERMFEDKK